MIVTSSAAGWLAQLNLDFRRQESRTILAQCEHRGPLQVQRPFYPEGDAVCHVAILHPPGGVVGGDQLQLAANLSPNTHALLTTPAAGKFYRSVGPTARQIQHLTVASGAALEWLPQETIVYNGARVHAVTRIELHGDARFLGWEILCLGRPAADELFTLGEYQQDFELWRDDEPLYLEHGRYTGGTELLNARWGLQGQPVTATLLCAPAAPEQVDAIRATWEALQTASSPSPPLRADGDEWVTISSLDGASVCRYLGPSATRARQFFTLAWGLLRPALLRRSPCPSRFWNT